MWEFGQFGSRTIHSDQTTSRDLRKSAPLGRQLFDGHRVSLSRSDSPLRDSRCNGRRAVDRNRFRRQARLEKEKLLRNGLDKCLFLALGFALAAG